MPDSELSVSQEDYLEAIFHIVEEKQAARAGDIAKRMNVSSPSVTGALHMLAERNLVNYQPYDIITLTPEGHSRGQEIVRRHEALHDFFVRILGSDGEEAEKAACGMEHAMPRDLLERFLRFCDFIELCPRSGGDWLQQAETRCHHKSGVNGCVGCIEKCLETVQHRAAETSASEFQCGLHTLEAGTRACIIAIEGNPESARRLGDMGLAPGDIIEVEELLPPDQRIMLKTRGYHLTLRQDEAMDIRVEPL